MTNEGRLRRPPREDSVNAGTESDSLETGGNCPSRPAVSVVMPCRNERDHIERSVRNALAFDTPPGGFEVIVVDGMSTDGTRDILRDLSDRNANLRVLDNPHQTTSHALNIGIRAARGLLVARIDAHTDYAPDYVRQCVEVMRESGADNVGGPALTVATTYIQRAIAAAYHSRFAVGNGVFHQPRYEGPADTVPYGCYSRQRLLELGLFDEELVRNQDDELNYRLIRAGGRIWQSPRIRSWYRPRGSLKGLFWQYWQYGYWKVRVIRKHLALAAARHLVPGAFMVAVLLMTLLAVWIPAARNELAVFLGLYLAALVVASVTTAARKGWDLLPALPVVFACYHLGYGLGFLFGVWDFIVRHRPEGRFVFLTRT